jgi:hypothetical protein
MVAVLRKSLEPRTKDMRASESAAERVATAERWKVAGSDPAECQGYQKSSG